MHVYEWHTLAPYLGLLAQSPDPLTVARKWVVSSASEDIGDDEAPEDEEEGEDLCDCQFSLAYGAKILLNDAVLRLKRGHRYGLCGKNGTGKSTLMRAITNGQVEGFPSPDEVRTFYVEHDIDGSEEDTSVLQFILTDKRILASEGEVVEALASVNFNEERQKSAIGSLSGGWKLKLAMDLVPEHHPSTAPEGEVGPAGPTYPPQPQLPTAADTADLTQSPQTNTSPTEESASSNAPTSTPGLPTSALMGPGQPGTQASGLPLPPPPPEETVTPHPKVGPHAAISSSSAFNMFEPHYAPENTEAQIIQGLLPADRHLMEKRLDELRESANGILTGVANFYNQGSLIAARHREGQPPICDEQTMNAAFKIVLNVLDAGFPPEADAPHPPMVEGAVWFRAVISILAAVGRGMIRSTPAQLKAAAESPLNLKEAFLQLSPEILQPKSDGEMLQCLAEQIAGMVNFRNDLNLDANPYSFFDAIKERARPLLEEGANLEAKAEVEAWKTKLTNHLKSCGLEELMKDIQKELNENPVTSDRQEATGKEIIARAGAFKKMLLDQARKDVRTSCAEEIKAAAEQERASYYKEELERVQREESRNVNQEVRNWRISYKEKKEQEFQSALDAEVKAANIAAVIQAAKELGLKPSDFKGAQSAGEKTHRPGPPLNIGPPPAKAGSKRTASGNMAPPPPPPTPASPMEVVPEDGNPARNTRSRSRERGPREDPLSLLPADAPRIQRAPSPFVSGVASSMHNPANAMAVDAATQPGPGPQEQTGANTPTQTGNLTVGQTPNEEPLVAIQAMLMTLTARIEQVASLVEGPSRRPQNPAVATVPKAPATVNRPPRVDIPRQKNPDDGFIQADPPRRAWNNVTAQGIAQQEEAKKSANKAAVAQGRNQTGRPTTRGPPARALPSNTEVTVLRDGGLTDQAAEAAVRAQRPDNIVQEVQRQINAQVKNNPIQILAGRWSSSVKRTGNFIFTIRGQVNFPLVASYSRFLLAPFPGSELAPSGNWTWAQLRGVPVWDETDTVHSQEQLLAELRSNPAFESAILTTQPRWQIPIERLTGDTGTVVFSYCDPDESITRQAREDHVFLFGTYVKFTISPSRPALIQCSRCHQLGLARNSKACHLPVDAIVCFKCGGPHRSEQHGRECRRIHRDVGICDCPPKCILCGNNGHFARDPKCPKRAEFAPPRASNHLQPNPRAPRNGNPGNDQEGWTTVGGRKRSRVPARPAYRGTGGGKGKQPPPPSPASEHARIDDTASETQVEHSLWMDYDDLEDDYTPGQGWDNNNDDNISLNGTRRTNRPVPRNATPGPSNA